MTDREKVIEHLKEIAEYFRGCRSNASFASKAENHFWELQNAASEAAELLKAQEPRLLTIEEITGDGECWFEGINGACGYADCYMCTGSKEVEVHRISMKPEYVSWDDFKKKWRCWSYRPTDEQRKAAKWNE